MRWLVALGIGVLQLLVASTAQGEQGDLDHRHRIKGRLGLAVVREIVMKDGRTIRVEGGDGGGARFVVSLPCLR